MSFWSCLKVYFNWALIISSTYDSILLIVAKIIVLPGRWCWRAPWQELRPSAASEASSWWRDETPPSSTTGEPSWQPETRPPGPRRSTTWSVPEWLEWPNRRHPEQSKRNRWIRNLLLYRNTSFKSLKTRAEKIKLKV